jgi:hypothetical protein
MPEPIPAACNKSVRFFGSRRGQQLIHCLTSAWLNDISCNLSKLPWGMVPVHPPGFQALRCNRWLERVYTRS